jgi:Ca-activated chloride channel homolog
VVATLLLLVVLAAVAGTLFYLRKRRRDRWQRNSVTNNHDDPFGNRPSGPVAAEEDKPVSAAMERFAQLPLTTPPKIRVPRIAVLAAVLVLLLVGAGLLWWPSGDEAPAAQPAPEKAACDVRLRVAAAPEIAPVVLAAAKTVNGGADCGPVQVTAEQPAATASSKSGPDVWIPSSSLWLAVAAGDGLTYRADGQPMARSPIVVAGPPQVIAKISKDGRTAWAALVEGAAKHELPAITMADPMHDTVGMLSVYAIHQAMNRTTPDQGIAQLRALTLRSRLADATTDPAALLEKAAGGNADVGVFAATEQQLGAYQKGGHAVTLSAAVPADGLVEADYPYAVSPAADSDLAARLHGAITAEALTAAGFRTDKPAGALAMPAERDAILTTGLQWSQYKTLNFQVLLLIDGSGSMNEKITERGGSATTKAGLLRKTGLNASQLFGEETDIGMWYFATSKATSPAHSEALPFGPITGKIGGSTRREVLGERIGQYTAIDNAGTPLYQTVLDGLDSMRAKAKPGTVTLVVVLTDGMDQGSRFAMTNAEFLGKLAAARDAARPVPIIAVGYGANADMTALSGMAKATGGVAVPANDPADVASAMAKAFLAAHAPG